MADMEQSKHPADSLEDTLAVVLKQTGKFFRASQFQDSRRLAIAKASLTQTIPAANNRFHKALDDIEIQIVGAIIYERHLHSKYAQIKAKSVFERDLSSIRAKRAARERAAAGFLRVKSPNGVVKKSTQKGSPKEKTTNVNQATGDHLKPKTDGASANGIIDIPMTEEPAVMNSQQSPPHKEEEASNDAVKTEPFSIPASLSQDPSEPKGLAISLAQDPPAPTKAVAPVKPDPEPNTAMDPPSNDQTSQPPLSATFPDAQFESMFNDTDLPTTNDLEFDLNFTTDDPHNGADLLDASAFQNISLPTDPNPPNAQPNPTTTANEDLTALLPGLENYVNGSNDFSSLTNLGGDLFTSSQGNNVTIPTSLSAAGDVSTVQLAPPAQQAPIESSFEDMFGLDSYMNGTGDDELGGAGGMGEVGDFDEDWFKSEGI
ncbi:MAG: hypothetical protein LQ346_006878 [Caloplaca aetnensis]|nr:MAG: hypothetical protein LQ346_006878 [Caloplaca aetnensis]